MLAAPSAKLAAACTKCGRLHETDVDKPRPDKCLSCNAPLIWPAAKRPRLSKLAKQAARAELNGRHPALTGTTTPAGIAANDPDADWEARLNRQRAKEFSRETERLAGSGAPDPADGPGLDLEPLDEISQDTGQVVQVGLDLIHVHPKNRRPDAAAVQALADSFRDAQVRQLQPILVRVPPQGSAYALEEGHVQIVFGERRYKAAALLNKQGLAGWESIEARIRTDLDDASTLAMMAEENAKRQDLNPIERARLIETLCEPLDKGGAGLTREAAAKRVGLASGSAASNLVRLLELPKVWQDRVAGGELPESFARLLLPVLPLKAVMERLEREWKERGEPYNRWDNPNAFASRDVLEGEIQGIIDDECAMVFPDRKDRDAIDTSSAATQKALGIVEMQLPTGGNRKLERVHVVTNLKAYKKLRDERSERRLKVQAEKSGRDEKPAKRELSPAEQRAKGKERAEQLTHRIAAWRHDWLKALVARDLFDHPALRERLLVAVALDEIDLTYGEFGRLPEAVRAAVKREKPDARGTPYDLLRSLGGDSTALYEAGTALVRAAIECPDLDPKFPHIKHAMLDEIAATAGIDLAAEWVALQEDWRPHLDRGRPLVEGEEARFERFFLLFQTNQLDAVGKELGVHVAEASGKAAKIKLLTSRDRNLPLPKAIKPLAAGGGRKQKAAKGAKGKGAGK